ncbi:MAG: hypothetical protein ACJ8KX_09380 [Chthoniobacterales bacterium]
MKTSLIPLCLLVALSSCTTYEAARDTHAAREYLNQDLEEQIVFNLIRASNGLPFAHYDVTTVQALVTSKATGTAGASRSDVSNGFQPAAVVTTAVRAITRSFIGGVTGERSNVVTINIKPIFDDPNLYMKYATYLNLPAKSWSKDSSYNRFLDMGRSGKAKKEMATVAETTEKTTQSTDQDGHQVWEKTTTQRQSGPSAPPVVQIREFMSEPRRSDSAVRPLEASSGKPTREAYVPNTLRHWNGTWYYIPAEFRPEFSDFCLSLIARAGSVSRVTETAEREERRTRALEDLSSESIKNGALDQLRR